MQRLAITLGAAALFVAAFSAAQDPAPAEGIAWRTDLEAARADAQKSGRPLLIVFR